MVAEEFLVFSLKLMSGWYNVNICNLPELVNMGENNFFADDWRSERPSNQYFLGDSINIEASLMSHNHIPLRVFVDSCVATSVPDTSATLRYSFIENNG